MREFTGYTSYDSCKALTLEELKIKLEGIVPCGSASSIPIGELCSETSEPNGVYLFYGEDKELWYVGKATSRSFVERIPSHFDSREKGWFNTLPKKIWNSGETAASTYEEAHQKALTLHLVMVGVKQPDDGLNKRDNIGKKRAGALETVLRNYLKPRLNTFKKPKEYNHSGSIESLLDSICSAKTAG